MNLDKRINSLVLWGNSLDRAIKSHLGEKIELNTFEEKFLAAAQLSKSYNGWFSINSVIQSAQGIREFLHEDNLKTFASKYASDMEKISSPKRVLLIMAGNIPMVGFHDLLCTLLCGHTAVVKSSSDDSHLLPALCEILKNIDSSFADKIEFIERPMKNFDAVIATGSDNSAKYFDYYFGKYPNIIRKNRVSIAVLDGNESEDELKEFSKDVFQYFGLGCRNVSKVFVPKGYQFKNMIEAFQIQLPYLENNKYQNNLEYQKAVMLLNKDPFIDAGFFFMKENTSPFSSVSVLHYQQYENISEVKDSLNEYQNKIQCVVGKIDGGVAFGHAQCPGLNDFADGVDTMKFLVSL